VEELDTLELCSKKVLTPRGSFERLALHTEQTRQNEN